MQYPVLHAAPPGLWRWQFDAVLLDTLRQLVPHEHASIDVLHAGGAMRLLGHGEASLVDPLLRTRAFAQLGQAVSLAATDPVGAVLSQAGAEHCMAVAVPVRGGHALALIGLARSRAAAPFTAAQAGALSAAAPHLIEALLANRVQPAVPRAPDAAEVPLAFATPDGWLIYSNAAFTAAWAASAVRATSLLVPKVPAQWLEGGVPADSPLASEGWEMLCAELESGLRIELKRRVPVTLESKLTRREQEVAQLYGSGYTHKDIGKLLSMSPNTVRAHVGRIFEKLSINSRALLRTSLYNDGRFGAQ